MHHTSILYIRRLMVGIIVLVFLLVLGNYLYTRYRRNPAETQDLQILDSEMVQSVESFEYSDTRHGVLRFKIRARSLLEERPGRNYFEGIEAFDFNPDGSVRNKILSRYAEYDSENSTVDFIEDVRLFLGGDIELRTHTLHYDLDAEIGSTKDPVQFYSENITGKARGLLYRLDRKFLELENDVDFLISMENESRGGAAAVEEMNAVSDKAFYYEGESRIKFQGNASLESDSLLLAGDTIRADVDEAQNSIKSLFCSGNASYRSEADGETRILSGEHIDFKIHPGSRNLERIHVSGLAEFHSISSSEDRRLNGSEITLYFEPLREVLGRIEALTGVELRMKRDTEETIVSGGWLEALFYSESGGLKSINVREQAKINMTGTAGAADNEILGDRIDIQFREQSDRLALDTLRAQGAARWTVLPDRQDGEARASFSGTMDADVIEMFYAKEGRFLDRIHSSGNVTMTEISADAKDASYTRKISADSVRFQFFPEKNEPKNMTAEGSVRVVYEGESTTTPGKPVAFNTGSDVLEADFASGADGIVLASASQWGNFTYEDASMSATSGRCDYDAQKETMLLRDSPEIFFELGRTAGDTALFNLREGTLQIQNNVRSIVSGTNEPGLLGESSAGSSTVILADTMDHMVETSHTLYTGNVQLLSDEQQLQAEKLEILNGGEIVDAAGRIRHRIFRNRISADKGTRIGNSSAAASKDDGNAAGLPINIESSNFKYLKDIKTFTYSGEISLKSSDLQLKSGTLEAVLNDSGEDIQWARAENEVVFFKGKWECRGDVGYYFLEPERIEVEGDPAVCIDDEGMKPSAPRLTYNVADDRILLRERVD